MKTSSLVLAAVLSSMTMFACGGASPATQRLALGPARDESAWRPADTTELSFGAGAATASGETRASDDGLRPAGLRPNHHEAKRGALYSVAGIPASKEIHAIR
jgi:hypothetical protein